MATDSPVPAGSAVPGASPAPVVRQLRLVVEAADHEAAVAFFRDALGLPQEAEFISEGDARVVILDAGRATLEIANPAQKRLIDEVEVGRQVAPRIRVAFEVDDTEATTARLVAAGASEIAPPTRTPWQSLNSRLDAPADLQITIFQELPGPDEGNLTHGVGPDANSR
ncbi:glyoxalase/bleomycin resistance protein/dioxygenase superfamily protein [Micromonospora violae]|uniref:Glyoxalase/bleomycin resistance protein/dioxygenase superfamily protein n=1 Tax=Micromonospora violae TaxID=1278207 RepID=A0A4Q7UDP9_9ACTN|nr:VOC family protein [Micromonospora violae]RZT78191.1 glyoxalase/bleomycin resistance protein/dioxygenase superfamily protein [Micromonospora violae]